MDTPLYKKSRTDYSSAMEIVGGPQPGGSNGATGSSSAQRTRLSDAPRFASSYPASKFDKINSVWQKWRYNNIGAFTSPKTVTQVNGAGTSTLSGLYGRYPFCNQNPGYGSGMRPPMFIYSLTRANQTNNGTSDNQYAYAAYPVISDTLDLRFVVPGDGTGQNCPTLQGFSNGGVVTNNQQLIDSGQYSVPAITVGSTAMLHSADITLQLYGQKNKATRFRVMICQFDEDNSPLQNTTTAGTPEFGLGYVLKSDAAMFWINWIKKLTWNPSHRAINGKNTGMRVMFERYIYVDPVQNTDNDGSPQVCTYRLQPFFGRLCNYRWANPSVETISEAWAQTSGINGRVADLQCDVEPKARIYLVVTADNYVQTTTAAGGTLASASDSIPSMEFDINTTWRIGA